MNRLDPEGAGEAARRLIGKAMNYSFDINPLTFLIYCGRRRESKCIMAGLVS
jgi:hypothetical protein